MPRRLEASGVKAAVLWGVGGLRGFLRAVTDWPVPGLEVPLSAASASERSQNLSVSWWASKPPSGWANLASSSQKGLGTCARRSISRSTTRPRVGLWTGPPERKVEAERRGGGGEGGGKGAPAHR